MEAENAVAPLQARIAELEQKCAELSDEIDTLEGTCRTWRRKQTRTRRRQKRQESTRPCSHISTMNTSQIG